MLRRGSILSDMGEALRGRARRSLMPWAPPISRPISSTEALAVASGVGEHADIDDRQPVGEHQQLVEILRDDQDGGAVGGERDQRLMDRGRGAGIDAPGRLRDDQHARVLQDLAADHELLQVAARQAARQRVDAGRADVELLDDLRREVARLAGAG